jgi:hypothetical protein
MAVSFGGRSVRPEVRASCANRHGAAARLCADPVPRLLMPDAVVFGIAGILMYNLVSLLMQTHSW